MAQGNMLLGMARGSVGDVTFARSARKQVSRARNRKPNNPRTLAQIRQRIFLKTAALAYSVLAKDIADQTFEGCADSRENQQRFMKQNISMLRNNVGADNALYAPKGAMLPPLNAYIVAQGTLFSGWWNKTADGIIATSPSGAAIATSAVTTSTTYREFAQMLGLPAGSQLTFIRVIADSDDGYALKAVVRSRIVLAASDGTVDKAMFTEVSTYTLNDPNPENEGVSFAAVDSSIAFVPAGTGDVAAAIASNFDKKWRYSNAALAFSAETGNNFADAVESWQSAAGTESVEYTRQAEADPN